MSVPTKTRCCLLSAKRRLSGRHRHHFALPHHVIQVSMLSMRSDLLEGEDSAFRANSFSHQQPKGYILCGLQRQYLEGGERKRSLFLLCHEQNCKGMCLHSKSSLLCFAKTSDTHTENPNCNMLSCHVQGVNK